MIDRIKRYKSTVVFIPLLAAILFTFASAPGNNEITAAQLKNKIEAGDSVIVLDVRTREELIGPLGKIEGSLHIHIGQLESRVDELEKYKDEVIYVICYSGVRSARGTQILIENGYKAKNVIDGMLAYRKK